ncbi:MAG: DUF433 domain-containing protein [Candidatus Omnitrophica bacterium]|nr:DUF433 domain-containing protein [Candidatus Omnitrophota bacterium]
MNEDTFKQFISISPDICRGKPCFRINNQPTRIMLYLVLEMLEDGASYEEIIRHYPNLTRDHIRAALHYAAEIG